ncbi:unnamed protein product [Polarella glacialis]|uniref:Uncharacterized protein n=1 Tax=Polarella glacialis TaxID=89957 RepID=A0A813GV64_POLGL|nr:unnamed protein product [Polarella glacialis]
MKELLVRQLLESLVESAVNQVPGTEMESLVVLSCIKEIPLDAEAEVHILVDSLFDRMLGLPQHAGSFVDIFIDLEQHFECRFADLQKYIMEKSQRAWNELLSRTYLEHDRFRLTGRESALLGFIGERFLRCSSAKWLPSVVEDVADHGHLDDNSYLIEWVCRLLLQVCARGPVTTEAKTLLQMVHS